MVLKAEVAVDWRSIVSDFDIHFFVVDRPGKLFRDWGNLTFAILNNQIKTGKMSKSFT